MGEDLHEILQNSSKEEYTENKHMEGNNVEIDKEADETEETAIQREDDGRKTGSCCASCTIRHFHIILE
jgi:hypothetical protein